jgi:hypothetical protein
MLSSFNKGIRKKEFKHPIRQIHDNILSIDESSNYDFVFGNFFLNVFAEEMLVKILSQLVKLAKEKGYVVIGDFSHPTGNPVARLFQIIYWRIANLIFWAFADCALHPFYDYEKYMRQLGLKIKAVKHFKFLFDDRYSSILGQKK